MSTDLREGQLAETEQDKIDECRTRFNFVSQADSANRKEFEYDKRFVSGDQWEPQLRDERFSDRRPCLTVNLTDAICRRIVNACRENRPRIVVHPVGNGADVATAKVFDGLIRHIEYASSAAHAYDNAVENAVHGGFGWLGIDADYTSEDSFDQDLKIVGYSNPLICYGDPNSRLPDGSDMDFFIETSMMKRTEYRIKFGHLDMDGWKYAGPGDNIPDWSNKEEIRVAKYWRVERHMGTLYRYAIQGPVPRLKSGFDKPPPGATILDKRPVLRRRIRSYLMTATKILKDQTWPGKWIPRVPVYGRQLDINGQVQRKGMVRDLRDPARLYNYAQTAKTESYAMQAKVVWFGPAGFTEGFENAYRDMNRKPIVVAEYKPTSNVDGSPNPPPIKVEPPQPNAAFAEWGESTKSDFLAVAGMPHDPDVDKQGEVVSGIALKRRQGISDVSNYDFYDNLCRSLNHLGRIIVDLVPHYYDAPRIIRIIREDGQAEQVKINDPQMVGATIKVANDLTIGDYEVIVDTGPSYQTKREESAEAMLELLGTPAGEMVAQAAADVMVRSMDFPNSDKVADRLMTLIPAAQAEKQLGDMQPEQLKSMVAGLQQQLQKVNQQLMAAHLEIEAKHGLEKMKQGGETQRVQIKEAHADWRERLKTNTLMHDTHVKAVTQHDVAEIGGVVKLMDSAQERSHEKEIVTKQMSHEIEMGERGFLHDLAMGAQAGNQQAAEGEKSREHEEHMTEKSQAHEAKLAKSQPKPK